VEGNLEDEESEYVDENRLTDQHNKLVDNMGNHKFRHLDTCAKIRKGNESSYSIVWDIRLFGI
jgi:hypothetical protein